MGKSATQMIYFPDLPWDMGRAPQILQNQVFIAATVAVSSQSDLTIKSWMEWFYLSIFTDVLAGSDGGDDLGILLLTNFSELGNENSSG